jgi:CHAT domain-containing protein/tetratricopeptide (TPR) repeat protein
LVTSSPRRLDRGVRRSCKVGLLSVIVLAALSCPPSHQPSKKAPTAHLVCSESLSLGPGRAITRHLPATVTHEFLVKLPARQFVHFEVEQLGIDLKASLLDPHGTLVVDSDRLTYDTDSETLLAVTQSDGAYTVRLTAVSQKGRDGDYQLRIEESRPATATDRLRADAARLFSEAERARVAGDLDRAEPDFAAALASWSRQGDDAWQGECLDRMGRISAAREHWRTAARLHARAADLFRRAGCLRREAVSRHHVGLALFNDGRVADSVGHYQSALRLLQAVKFRRGEIITLHALGQAYQALDEIQLSLDYYRQALQLTGTAGDARLRAYSLHNLGVLYLNLGQSDHARDLLEAAEKAWEQSGDERGRAASLNQLGDLHLRRGETGEAYDSYQEALDIRRLAHDSRGEAASLRELGRLYQRLGQVHQAEGVYARALELTQRGNYPRSEAVVRMNLGSLSLERGAFSDAVKEYRAALELFEQSGDPTGQGECLGGIARALRGFGRLRDARDTSLQALARFESVRPRALSLNLRASFFSTVQQHFDSHIAILMDLAQREPGRGWEAEALATAEQARSRSLMEYLAVPTHAPAELLDQERALYAQVNRLEERRLRLADSARNAAKLQDLERAVRETLVKLDDLRAEMAPRRARRPGADIRPLTPAEIQNNLLDARTILLEYRLGEEASFLWALTRQRLHAFKLPPRREIETRARWTHRLLERSSQREAQVAVSVALADLSGVLLSPVAPLLGEQRLVIVAEGALLDVPFAALPDPAAPEREGAQARPLALRHELVYLPSASTLTALRRPRAASATPAKWLAVVADPVFGPTDSRLGRRSDQTKPVAFEWVTESAWSSLFDPSQFFARLPFSEQEALAISNLVPATLSTTLLGFDASKTWATSGQPGNYRVLHFATHAIVNPEYPQLSALALSQADRQGHPLDGLLRCCEICRLDLRCDLVTLAACRTAAGRETRGEGAESIARAFLQAGARSVLVSLWNVDDRASAELMRRFYSELFAGNRSAAAALQAAQMSMRQEPAWSAPYYWAGAALEGEWLGPNAHRGF